VVIYLDPIMSYSSVKVIGQSSRSERENVAKVVGASYSSLTKRSVTVAKLYCHRNARCSAWITHTHARASGYIPAAVRPLCG